MKRNVIPQFSFQAKFEQTYQYEETLHKNTRDINNRIGY